MAKSAGEKLRADLDQALAHAAQERGPLEFDEIEKLAIDRAVIAADRAEALRRVFAEEIAGERRSSVLTRLSAEARQLDRTAVDLARSVATGLGAPLKSERHQRAIRARWDRLMSRRPTVPTEQTSPLYEWLLRREEEAHERPGCSLPWSDTQPSYTGSTERLQALRRGDPVDVPLSALPPWARDGEPLRWSRRGDGVGGRDGRAARRRAGVG